MQKATSLGTATQPKQREIRRHTTKNEREAIPVSFVFLMHPQFFFQIEEERSEHFSKDNDVFFAQPFNPQKP